MTNAIDKAVGYRTCGKVKRYGLGLMCMLVHGHSGQWEHAWWRPGRMMDTLITWRDGA